MEQYNSIVFVLSQDVTHSSYINPQESSHNAAQI